MRGVKERRDQRHSEQCLARDRRHVLVIVGITRGSGSGSIDQTKSFSGKVINYAIYINQTLKKIQLYHKSYILGIKDTDLKKYVDHTKLNYWNRWSSNTGIHENTDSEGPCVSHVPPNDYVGHNYSII